MSEDAAFIEFLTSFTFKIFFDALLLCNALLEREDMLVLFALLKGGHALGEGVCYSHDDLQRLRSAATGKDDGVLDYME